MPGEHERQGWTHRQGRMDGAGGASPPGRWVPPAKRVPPVKRIGMAPWKPGPRRRFPGLPVEAPGPRGPAARDGGPVRARKGPAPYRIRRLIGDRTGYA